jgi:hypothetical protein
LPLRPLRPVQPVLTVLPPPMAPAKGLRAAVAEQR